MSRDFTFIEDIVEGTFLCALKAPNNNEIINSKNKVPNKIFNIGLGKPIMLNYFIDYQHLDIVLDLMFEQLGEPTGSVDLYIPEESLKEMSKNGMIIGSHSSSHYLMSRLSLSDQLSDLKESFEFLDNIVCQQYNCYCHPYGGFHSFNNDTISALDCLGVSYSFNVDHRDITSKDIIHSKHFLPRYDCNRFPYGSIFI